MLKDQFKGFSLLQSIELPNENNELMSRHIRQLDRDRNRDIWRETDAERDKKNVTEIGRHIHEKDGDK